MAYEWSQTNVQDPAPGGAVDIIAVRPWGQGGEEAFQLSGRIQLSDMSGAWSASTPLAELGKLREVLAGAGWEQITFTTVQEVTRTVVEKGA